MSGTREETREAVVLYMGEGMAPIPIPHGEKNPNRRGWQMERHGVVDIPRCWDNGQGVGVLWGEPSGGLVDVDMDWPEARAAARRILPPTRTFGRPGSPESHLIIRVVGGVPKTMRFKIGGAGDERSVVELLATGTQSLVPPSFHGKSGERRQWYRERDAVEMDAAVLVEAVSDIATAALLARNWPGSGARHEYVLAATGYVGRHLPRPRAERVMLAAISASGDEEAESRHGDVRDTLDALAGGRPTTGGPALDALTPGVVDQLRRWHRWGGVEARQAEKTIDPSFNLTDLGNAERLVHRHGEDLRYDHSRRKWLVWDDKRWRFDDSGEIVRRAKETVKTTYLEAAPGGDSPIDRDLARHALRSESTSRIEAMISLARSEPGIAVAPDAFDSDLWLLNCQNGTVDLRTGERREHRREDMLTKLAGADYDSDAEAPRFAAFMREVLVEDEMIGFVQRFAGYTLTGSTRERVVAILHGRGKNGKSTLIEVLQDVLGDYGRNTSTETLLTKRHEGVGNDVAALQGARFVSAAEVEKGRRLAESKVKQLTGNDTVTARFLYGEPFDFRPQFKLWLSTNNKPEIVGTDDAIWDRIRLIPFTQRFAGTAADAKLPERLREELPGILAWAVEGCRIWQAEGLGEPEGVKTATEDYRLDMDTLATFIADRCYRADHASVLAERLYEDYRTWCAETGENAETQKKFGGRLRERGFDNRGPKQPGTRKTIWRGIGLADPTSPPDEGIFEKSESPEDEKPLEPEKPSETFKTTTSPVEENKPGFIEKRFPTVSSPLMVSSGDENGRAEWASDPMRAYREREEK